MIAGPDGAPRGFNDYDLALLVREPIDEAPLRRGAASANAFTLSMQGRTRRATDGADVDTIVEVSGTNISCP